MNVAGDHGFQHADDAAFDDADTIPPSNQNVHYSQVNRDFTDVSASTGARAPGHRLIVSHGPMGKCWQRRRISGGLLLPVAARIGGVAEEEPPPHSRAAEGFCLLLGALLGAWGLHGSTFHESPYL